MEKNDNAAGAIIDSGSVAADKVKGKESKSTNSSIGKSSKVSNASGKAVNQAAGDKSIASNNDNAVDGAIPAEEMI